MSCGTMDLITALRAVSAPKREGGTRRSASGCGSDGLSAILRQVSPAVHHPYSPVTPESSRSGILPLQPVLRKYYFSFLMHTSLHNN